MSARTRTRRAPRLRGADGFDEDGLRIAAHAGAAGAVAVRRPAQPRSLQPHHLRRHRRPRPPQAHPGALRPGLPRRAALRHHDRRLRPPGHGRRGLPRPACASAIDDHYGEETVDESACERILLTPRYVQGEFDDAEGYQRLSALLDELDRDGGTRGNRLFYLATPPRPVPRDRARPGAGRPGAHRRLRRRHGQGEPVPGWTRIVVEKPFGHDEPQRPRAQRRSSAGVFDEKQVYRIDHYLAKETVQNLLVLRFANGIFEPVWNRRYVDHVQITAAETLGVEHRAPYYEAAGALRDMITPHLLQLFTLVAMEPPVTFDADDVRDEKLKVLRSVRPIPPDRVDLFAVRGQYVDGLRRRRAGARLPQGGARRARLVHRDLRGRQAARRQLALARRALLPAHRQAPGAQASPRSSSSSSSRR